MKLSQTILQGCEGTEQHRKSYFPYVCEEDTSYYDYTKCCALGAALLATDNHRHAGALGMCYLIQLFPELNKWAICPVTGKVDDLQYIIVDLNDAIRWTREEIAQWLQEQGL